MTCISALLISKSGIPDEDQCLMSWNHMFVVAKQVKFVDLYKNDYVPVPIIK